MNLIIFKHIFYLNIKRLFLEISETSLEKVIFISFRRHDANPTYPNFFLGRSIYYIDSHCANCLTFIEQLSKVTEKITFTSFFHENISFEHCSILIKSITNSNVIIYDLIPKSNLLNFRSVSKMKEYFEKSNLLAEANLYTISRSTQAEVEREGLKVKNVIKYNLINKKNSSIEKDKIILLFGSLNPRKNILRIVKAWDLIQQDFPGYKLTLVGRYSKTSKLLILSIISSGSNSICFTGEISDLEIDNLFQMSELLIAPSTIEGLGLPLLRAIEFGTPLICANIDSYVGLVSNEESFFDPFSVHDITQKMRSAITSPLEYGNKIESVEIGTIHFSEVI